MKSRINRKPKTRQSNWLKERNGLIRKWTKKIEWKRPQQREKQQQQRQQIKLSRRCRQFPLKCSLCHLPLAACHLPLLAVFQLANGAEMLQVGGRCGRRGLGRHKRMYRINLATGIIRLRLWTHREHNFRLLIFLFQFFCFLC